MGRRKQKIVEVDQAEYSDADSINSGSTAISDHTLAPEMESVDSQDFTLDKHLDALYEKRGSTREFALTEIVSAFEGHVLLNFIEDRRITLLHQYINSLKRGSAKEACLAARAVGLLAITGGTGSNTHEIMDESIPPLSRALTLGPDAVRIFVVDSLAIVTFVGSNNWEETESTMKVIWEIIHPKSRSKTGTITKPSSTVLVAALSAWSFLLTTLTGWRVDLDMWIEMISFLCNLLEKGDRAVRIAAGEAIAVIFEIVVAGKLSTVTDDLESVEDMPAKPKWFIYLSSLKEKIISLVSSLSMEAGGKGTDKKSLNAQRDTFQKIYDYLQIVAPTIKHRNSSRSTPSCFIPKPAYPLERSETDEDLFLLIFLHRLQRRSHPAFDRTDAALRCRPCTSDCDGRRLPGGRSLPLTCPSSQRILQPPRNKAE